jgi:hypothetical protein
VYNNNRILNKFSLKIKTTNQMTIVLILLIVILGYWLSGFLPGRPIKPKRNRWHAWGPFGQIWGFIDGDKKSFLPKSMPWPFNKVFFTLTYTQFVEDEKNEAHEKNSADGKKISSYKASNISGIKKQVRTVNEEITRMRKTEIHPFIIKVTLPKTGGTFYLVFTVKIQIKNPMKMIRMEEFLVFVGNQLNDAVFPWAVQLEKTIVEANSTLPIEQVADTVIDALLGLKIDTDESIMIGSKTLKEYMNIVIKEYGGVIPDFSLDVGYDEEIKKILELRNKQKLEDENRKNEEKISLTKDVTRARDKKDGLLKIELEKKELDDVIIPKLEAQGSSQAQANKAWGEGGLGTLFIGEQKPNILIEPTPNTKQKGGGNATT